MTPEIKKVRLGELQAFCRSELYNQFAIIPITPSRADSYLDNPNGNSKDVVLLLALLNGELLAFRSIFAGIAYAENRNIRFGWCSGSWVDPDFRRKGLSQLLLKEAYNDWNGRLMFTNYAPESESLYLKTGWFKPVHEFKGARGYLFPETSKLVPSAKKSTVVKLFFRLIDFFTGNFSSIRILFYRSRKPDNVGFELLNYPDEESFNFMESFRENYLFRREAKEISWILESPWISEINRPYNKKYPFSACAESFYYRIVKLFYNNELAGVSLFSVREGHLKTLFFWLPPHLETEMAEFLKDFTLKHKLEMITVYHRGIAGKISARKSPFLYVKNMGQKIYSSFDISGIGNYRFHDGDGDRAFT